MSSETSNKYPKCVCGHGHWNMKSGCSCCDCKEFRPLPADEERKEGWIERANSPDFPIAQTEPVAMHRDIVGEDGIHYKQTTMGNSVAASSEGVKRPEEVVIWESPSSYRHCYEKSEADTYMDHLERENASLRTKVKELEEGR